MQDDTISGIRSFESAGDYVRRMVQPEQITKYLPPGGHFIDEAAINSALKTAAAHPNDVAQVRAIIAKSRAIETLTLAETATLLYVTDPELRAEMEEAALAIKRAVYDNRIVTFAPLYTSNLCVNRCAYCGFKADNTQQVRRKLSMAEIRNEALVLAGRLVHKLFISFYGEHPYTTTEYIAETIQTVYATQTKSRTGATLGIRRVNVNAAPLPVEDLRVLKSVGIGTFQVFQETYHRETYQRLHPAGTVKGHYDWRTTCMHRSLEAGADDVGLGVLFGLYDWRFEVLAVLAHSRDLEAQFGIGPHTISFPRMEPASGTDVPTSSPYRVSDDDFQKIMTVTRLAVPYTGMIVTCRETAAVRDRAVLKAGVTQMDASSNIAIGGYKEFAMESQQEMHRQQFVLADTRSLEELIRDLGKMGIITSFCTAGYRCGRTGGCIMDALKTGKEGKFCKVNAVLTFREWLDDFASPETRAICDPVLERELKAIASELPLFYPAVKESYDKIVAGERDLFF